MTYYKDKGSWLQSTRARVSRSVRCASHSLENAGGQYAYTIHDCLREEEVSGCKEAVHLLCKRCAGLDRSHRREGCVPMCMAKGLAYITLQDRFQCLRLSRWQKMQIIVVYDFCTTGNTRYMQSCMPYAGCSSIVPGDLRGWGINWITSQRDCKTWQSDTTQCSHRLGWLCQRWLCRLCWHLCELLHLHTIWVLNPYVLSEQHFARSASTK